MPLLLPFFKFDVQAWLTSETVSLMNNEQRGAFVTLLAKCWATITCTIPNDLGLVQQLADWKGSDDQFEQVWRCFMPDKKHPTRLFNRRLMKEWREAKLRQAFYAERAKAGADARWADKPVVRKKRTPTTAVPTDWLAELKANPLYAHVNWEREQGKMKVWNDAPENKHRIINRKFVVNWINKIEAPLSNGHVQPLICEHHPKLTFADKHAKDTHDFLYHPKYVG